VVFIKNGLAITIQSSERPLHLVNWDIDDKATLKRNTHRAIESPSGTRGED
jgi:hypothetical protein